jgi:hypothetical protein
MATIRVAVNLHARDRRRLGASTPTGGDRPSVLICSAITAPGATAAIIDLIGAGLVVPRSSRRRSLTNSALSSVDTRSLPVTGGGAVATGLLLIDVALGVRRHLR